MSTGQFRTVFPIVTVAALLLSLAVWVSPAQESVRQPVAPPSPEADAAPSAPAEAAAQPVPALRRPLMIPTAGYRVFFPPDSRQTEKINSALDDTTSFNFVDTPLTDAVEFIVQQHEVPLYVHVSALDDLGIPSDEPVNLVVKDITLRAALALMLDDLELTAIPHNEVLYLTSKTEADTIFSTRTYPVSDLVLESDPQTWDELVEAIVTTTSGIHWEQTGDTGGTIASVRAAGTIVVKQSYRGHEEVLNLLVDLRRSREITRKAAQAELLQSQLKAPPSEAYSTDESELQSHVIEVVVGPDDKGTIYRYRGQDQSVPQIIERLQKLRLDDKDRVLIRAETDVRHDAIVALLERLSQAAPKARVAIAVSK